MDTQATNESTTITIRLTGHTALDVAESADLPLSKFADPIEDAREGLTVSEAREIAAEDDGLIYLDLTLTEEEIDEESEPEVMGEQGPTAVLVAWLGEQENPEGYWPNDDADAFAVALGQAAIARGDVDDDQDGQDVDPHRSLTGYLDALTIEPCVETLTDDMIRALRDEASKNGDADQVKSCADALRGNHFSSFSRAQCAAAINAARASDDETPFVRVVA